jgi:hypothetical protein
MLATKGGVMTLENESLSNGKARSSNQSTKQNTTRVTASGNVSLDMTCVL